MEEKRNKAKRWKKVKQYPSTRKEAGEIILRNERCLSASEEQENFVSHVARPTFCESGESRGSFQATRGRFSKLGTSRLFGEIFLWKVKRVSRGPVAVVTRLVSLNRRLRLKATRRSAKSVTSKMSLCKVRVTRFVRRLVHVRWNVCASGYTNGSHVNELLSALLSPGCRPFIPILILCRSHSLWLCFCKRQRGIQIVLQWGKFIACVWSSLDYGFFSFLADFWPFHCGVVS